MSVRKMAEVWTLDVSAPWQQILLAMADHCDDDGYGCHPSARYLAWKMGKSERQVRSLMAELREINALKTIRKATQWTATDYYLDLSVLPKKAAFQRFPRDEIISGLKNSSHAEIAPLNKRRTVDNPVDKKNPDLKSSVADLKPTAVRPEVATSAEPSLTIIKPSEEEEGTGPVNKTGSEPEKIGKLLQPLLDKVLSAQGRRR